MFNFSKTYSLESRAFPGVVVKLRRIGPQKRAEIEMLVSAARLRQREIATRIEAIRLKIGAALDGTAKDEAGNVIEAEIPQDAVDLAVELQNLAGESRLLARSVIEPAFVSAAVLSIDGITYEDQPATADLLCVHGPDALFDEVAEAIGRNAYLTPEMAENFASPTTSGAQEDGQATSMIAASAGSSADISSATVASISPST